MKLGKKEWAWVIARVFVGFIFAYAGASKLLEPSANFEAVLFRYGVFSPQWIPFLAKTVPWLEWVLGSFLILGYAPKLAACGTAILALSFLVTLGSSRLFLQSGGTDCGCFGQGGLLHLSLRQIFAIDLLNFSLSLRMAFLTIFPCSLHTFLVKATHEWDDIKETKRSK